MNGMLTVVQGKPSKAVVDIQYSMLQQNLSIANPKKGIEVKPGSPYTCQLDQGVKLHISQATLGLGSSTRRSILKGAPKDKCAVFLCSLMVGNKCSCKLNLELTSNDEVTFSVNQNP
ncbi:unnamed protein product [Camellia sinensis]